MPVDGDEIGRVVEEGEGTFLWQIPDFSGLPKEEEIWFWSPAIHLAGAEWKLYINPNGVKNVPDRIFLGLWRLDAGPALQCTVGVRRADGGEEQVGGQTVKFGAGYAHCVIYLFHKRAEECVEGEFLSCDTLTLTLRITTEEGEAASPASPSSPLSRVMPSHDDTIGRVVEEGTFLWQIPEFSGLPKEEGIVFLSPDIDLAGTRWSLAILPNGLEYLSDRIVLNLWRLDDGPALQCTVGVRRADGDDERVGGQTVKFGAGYAQSVLYSFHKRAEECVDGDYLSSGTLTITLRIREEGEGGLLFSKETQRESSSQRQNDPSEEEGSSSKAKDKNSQETQKELPENTTDREDDATSPEAKGVMILSKHMKELLKNGEDCDVKIQVNDKEFPCHRCILKSHSPVFQMMLIHDCEENKSGVITIGDCDTEAFEELMCYIYSGKTRDLTPTKAIHLYYVADKYSFPELKEQCVGRLKTSFSTSNICDVILLSAKHEETDLLNMATKFFAQNIQDILVTVEWQNFIAKHPTEANELYIRSLKTLLPEK